MVSLKELVRQQATKIVFWPVLPGYGKAPSSIQVARWRADARKGCKVAIEELYRYQQAILKDLRSE